MKPARLKAEKERQAKVRLRRWAQRIPDNETFIKIMLQFPEAPFRRDFYRKTAPYLKFKPVPLEEIV